MGCCFNNFSVFPTDVITSNAPHCLWLITVLFLHLGGEKLPIISLRLAPKMCLADWTKGSSVCLKQQYVLQTSVVKSDWLPWCTTHITDDSGSAQTASKPGDSSMNLFSSELAADTRTDRLWQQPSCLITNYAAYTHKKDTQVLRWLGRNLGTALSKILNKQCSSDLRISTWCLEAMMSWKWQSWL